jgi:hypothetical protein
MSLFLLGATAMATATAGLLFLRMWRESRDRLYVMFAGAFWLEALARTAHAASVSRRRSARAGFPRGR